MKYYETNFDEYLENIKKITIHPELNNFYCNLPENPAKIGNIIFYGPSGVGKYSQVLYMLSKYSASELKHHKKMVVQNEKMKYICQMSDIHYEIDMSLLGCNSKSIWNDIFFQIIDVISTKNEKKGFIVCKNFHSINTELLNIFYSYMQHCNELTHNFQINFILITESVSFIPDNIIKCFQIIRFQKPSTEILKKILNENITNFNNHNSVLIQSSNDTNIEQMKEPEKINIHHIFDILNNRFHHNMINSNICKTNDNMFIDHDFNNIKNLKNLKSFSYFNKFEENSLIKVISDNIIQIIMNNQISFATFRENIYDILIYNLDIHEVIWNLLKYFIENDCFKENDISNILDRTSIFFKYYNNNYRPIYHLENIFIYFSIKIHNYNEENIEKIMLL